VIIVWQNYFTQLALYSNLEIEGVFLINNFPYFCMNRCRPKKTTSKSVLGLTISKINFQPILTVFQFQLNRSGRFYLPLLNLAVVCWLLAHQLGSARSCMSASVDDCSVAKLFYTTCAL
jgi:hypothetical protein